MEETENSVKKFSAKASFFLGLIVGLIIFGFCGFFIVYSLVNKEGGSPSQIDQTSNRPTFAATGEPVCQEDGKPIIRLFSLSTCPHCAWVKATYEKVAREYMDQGKIVAYNWEVDTSDNILTSEVETEIPAAELEWYTKYNADGYVPEFIFGCKYLRIGNGFEAEDDLAKEEAEFRRVIDELVNNQTPNTNNQINFNNQ